MPLSQSEISDCIAAIDNRLSSGKVDNWQRQFLTDMRARLRQHGTRTRLSQKQEAKLSQLTGVRLEQETPGPAPSGRKAGAGPSSHHTKLPRARWSYPRRRTSVTQIKYIAIAVLIVVGAIASLGDQASRSDPPGATAVAPTVENESRNPRFSVTDGDTIRLTDGTAVRLVGFNTPETFSPRCERGLQLGRQATARLNDLVQNASSVDLRIVPCACAPGTHGTRACNFGRSCGVLKVDGTDVGQTLISEGLAARFVCGRTGCPPTPRPWCS